MMRDISIGAKLTVVWLSVGRGATEENLEKINKGFESMKLLFEMYHVHRFRDLVHNSRI